VCACVRQLQDNKTMASHDDEAKNPSHSLIEECDVKTALRNDKGDAALLKSFEIRDFTSKGDNYAAVVTSVLVKYELEGEERSVSYVVKLNPCRHMELMEKVAKLTFDKEIGFYTKIIPMLNKELDRIDYSKLKVADCYHCVETPKKQAIYLEDLRQTGFKMADRQKGMDSKHVIILMKELAKLHAASSMLFSKRDLRDFNEEENFPELKEFLTAEGGAFDFGCIIKNGCEIFEVENLHPKMQKFVENYNGKSKDIFVREMIYSEKFKTICHGDCWTNNFLFRYSPDGEVEECRLLDLQIGRIGSPALDLNYLLFTSTTRQTRQAHLHRFLLEYYSEFASALAAGGLPLKFTLDELKREYRAKHAFGLLMGIMVIPATLVNKEETPDFTFEEGDDMEEKMKEYQSFFREQLKKSDNYEPRFVGMVEDLVECGFFDKYSLPSNEC